MSTPTCDKCLKPNGTFNCGSCNDALCKKCAQFTGPDDFSYLKKPPEVALHNAYCPACFDKNVAPELERYNNLMEAAKDMNVFFRGQGKEVRAMFIKKPDYKIEVKNCRDHDDTVMKLAFEAAKRKCNVIVDVETESKKHHDGSYITLSWSGTAVPAKVEAARIDRKVDPRHLRFL